MQKDLLTKILDDEFLQTLAKSADLYKIGSNSILDPQEIKIGLKVVPRAVMSLLISELTSMELNGHKDIQLPFGKEAFIRVNKNAADDYTGSVFDDNKRVYDFMNRSIPGLGLILLSTFELYDMEELSGHESGQSVPIDDTDSKVQKLIDERMELHSLVGRVVENKLAEREAIHKLMMDKLSEAFKKHAFPVAPTAPIPTPVVNHSETPKSSILPVGPIEVKPADITKKEDAPKEAKKGSPLKGFLERKSKPKEYFVQKCESRDCPDCGKNIFNSLGYSGCLCFAENQNSKIFIRKNEKDELSISFSKNWSPENIEMLLETLRRRNG
ncbi:MAG TPA: hypothetical protein VIJ14_08300 [Rhabdochlamydiaceae bacterium]